MSALVLDAGAFVGVERDDRAALAQLRVAQHHELELRSTGVVVGQVWRDPGGRQAKLARLLKAVDVVAVDEALGRDAGVLCARAGTSDVADASVVCVAVSSDRILTSDADDIRPLVDASGRSILLVLC